MGRDILGIRDACLTVGATILPALVSYGIGSVELAFEVGDEFVIQGLQFRDRQGLRASRETMPLTLMASIEESLSGLIASAAVGRGSGVIELVVADRTLIFRHSQEDANDWTTTHWAV
jgi:hypothetical protein